MNKANKSKNPDSQSAASASPQTALNGIFILDKPLGITSMRAVEIVRRRAGGTKTGHAGTLDPLATGVLVLALGPATKLIDRLMATTKRYRTSIDLTAFTTTDDAEGKRTEVAVDSPPDDNTVRSALTKFTGTFDQRPPAFSAVKIDGKRAYKMARKGKPVEIAARPVTVHALELIRYDWPEVELDIHCDKGFYVRSLARDLGEALGTGGYCTAIRRTAVGPFTLDTAVKLNNVPEPLRQEHLITQDEAIAIIVQ